MSTSAIIELLGGRQKTAKLCGVKPTAVSMWKTSGIPPWHWPKIVAHAERTHIPGVTYEAIQEARRLAREGAP